MKLLNTTMSDNVGIIATLIALLMFYDGKLLAFGLIKYLNHHQSDSSCKLCITASELSFCVDRTFSFCSKRQPDERLVWLPRSITSPAFVYSTGGMSTTQFDLARTLCQLSPNRTRSSSRFNLFHRVARRISNKVLLFAIQIAICTAKIATVTLSPPCN